MQKFELIDCKGHKSVVIIKHIASASIDYRDLGGRSSWVIDIHTVNSWCFNEYRTKNECEIAFKELNDLINDEL